MYARREVVSVTTDGAGAATAYSQIVSGLIQQVAYVKTDFANGPTFTITVESTGEAIWSESNVNASTSRAPRQATHSVLGAAALYAAGGTAVLEYIAIAQDRIKIVIASAGAAHTGAFHFLIW